MAHDASEDARRLLQAMEELQDRKVGYVMPEEYLAKVMVEATS